MNEYTITDLSAGHKEHFTVAITEKMMQQFFDVTGDENPLHVNEKFAKSRGSESRIVYGMFLRQWLPKDVKGSCEKR